MIDWAINLIIIGAYLGGAYFIWHCGVQYGYAKRIRDEALSQGGSDLTELEKDKSERTDNE